MLKTLSTDDDANIKQIDPYYNKSVNSHVAQLFFNLFLVRFPYGSARKVVSACADDQMTSKFATRLDEIVVIIEFLSRNSKCFEDKVHDEYFRHFNS